MCLSVVMVWCQVHLPMLEGSFHDFFPDHTSNPPSPIAKDTTAFTKATQPQFTLQRYQACQNLLLVLVPMRWTL